MLAAYRRQTPTDPLEHGAGKLGVSSRWWYLPGMYKPQCHCGRCTKGEETLGMRFTNALRRRNQAHVSGQRRPPIERTGELYRVPRLLESGMKLTKPWARECITWPRYEHGHFAFGNKGPSMLELSEHERYSLQIIVLKTSLQKETYGGAHHFNWKKIGLSRAYYKEELVCEKTCPTPRCMAAFRFLMQNNVFYKKFHDRHRGIIAQGGSHNISSYDLFVVEHGIECAIRPHLYPTTDFTDTGILAHYQDQHGDSTNRVLSIGLSWTRKVLSSVRAYGEDKDLSFFMYEKHLAGKFFSAQVRAQRIGVTGDVMARDSQASTGYWDIVSDSLADLVRIMLVRCYDETNYPILYKHCRGLRGEVWLCAFPNLFITIAPAGWRYPRPYFLEPYTGSCFAMA